MNGFIHKIWQEDGRNLSLHPVLNGYFIGLFLLGFIGFLSGLWNVFINPEIAQVIQPVLYVLAILHALFYAYFLMRRLNAEKPPSNAEREKRILMMGVLAILLAALFANAFMRGLPLISTYLWSQPQVVTAHIEKVREVKRLRRTCGGLLIVGTERSALKVTLNDFYWPNRVLCVGSYAEMMPSGKDYNSPEGTILLMPGYGNWFGFRVDKTASNRINPAVSD